MLNKPLFLSMVKSSFAMSQFSWSMLLLPIELILSCWCRSPNRNERSFYFLNLLNEVILLSKSEISKLGRKTL